MKSRGRCVLSLATFLSLLPAAVAARTTDWEGPFVCAPWYCYYYNGRYWYKHWYPGSADNVYVSGSTTGVSTAQLSTAASSAASQWTARASGLPWLTFYQGTVETYSYVKFVSDQTWLAAGLSPTARAATFWVDNANGTVAHCRIWLRIRATDQPGWCADCAAVGADCITSPGKYDLPSVLAHEFGHWWVVGDTYDLTCGENMDLMYWMVSPGQVNRIPSSEDVASAQSLYDQPVDVLASLSRSEATPERVTLVWSLGAGVGSAMVERCAPGAGWSALGLAVTDGVGSARYADESVVPGTRYGYRLSLSVDGSEVVAGETWVEVPRWQLALGALTPSPSRDGVLRLSYVLESAAPASIDVLDAGGRLARHVDADAGGREPHTLRLGDDTPFASGVYWVRLKQGTGVQTTRAVVVR